MNFPYFFSSFGKSTFQKTSKIFKPRMTQITGMNADHSQFWCLFTGPTESNPNSRMIRAKTIGVMLMASSIIDKKLPRRRCRAEHRATDSRLRTRRKRSSRTWLNSSSRYFLKRSKTDISQNVKFLSKRCTRLGESGSSRPD